MTKQQDFSNITILIAEDETINFLFLKEALSETKINIVRAKNGIDAIALFKEHNPEIILMDIRMPKMDGYKSTQEIRQLNAEVPIIAITAYSFAEDKSKALAAGCDDYLPKPIDIESLIEKISFLLKKQVA